MSINNRLLPYAAQLLTSQRLERIRERIASLRDALRGRRNAATFYFRVDDPYSWLLAQQLGGLSRETGLQIRPRTMLHLPREMYPEPAMHANYSVADARLAAALHGLQFTGNAPPTYSNAFAASRILLAHEDDPGYLSLAQTLCRHLWAGDIDAIHSLGTQTDVMAEKTARKTLEARRDSFLAEGHYLTATLHYGGSWYWGPDRLDYFRDRLARQRGQAVSAHRDWRRLQLTRPPQRTQGKTLEFFFSFRSPYSYLAVPRVAQLVRHYQLDLKIRPVLPMVMRGLAVPAAKRFYILKDAAREADRLGIPFGRICDPVGAGVERCMAVWPLAEKAGKLQRFIEVASQAIWSRGICVATDAGLKSVVQDVGLSWPEVKAALSDDGWIASAQANRDDMMAAGSWGVPTFRLDDVTVWGQDRLPVIEKLLLQEIAL